MSVFGYNIVIEFVIVGAVAIAGWIFFLFFRFLFWIDFVYFVDQSQFVYVNFYGCEYVEQTLRLMLSKSGYWLLTNEMKRGKKKKICALNICADRQTSLTIDIVSKIMV